MNQALTVSKTLVHETHERFLIIRKPFTMMLGFIDRRILWPRALHNPAFPSYGCRLGYENAQRAGVSQKGPQGEHD